MRDDPEDPERDDISRLEEMKESGVDPNYYLIINGFALFILCLQSDVAPQSVQRILKSSSCVHDFYICLLPRCDRLPVSPGQRIYIICHVVYRVN